MEWSTAFSISVHHSLHLGKHLAHHVLESIHLRLHLSLVGLHLGLHFILVGLHLIHLGLHLSLVGLDFSIGAFNFLVDGLSSFSIECLDGVDDSSPLVPIGIILVLSHQQQHIEALQPSKELHHLEAFQVEVHSRLVFEHLKLRHHILVALRDDRNQKVQQDDQHQELVQNPYSPHERDHEAGLVLFES